MAAIQKYPAALEMEFTYIRVLSQDSGLVSAFVEAKVHSLRIDGASEAITNFRYLFNFTFSVKDGKAAVVGIDVESQNVSPCLLLTEMMFSSLDMQRRVQDLVKAKMEEHLQDVLVVENHGSFSPSRFAHTYASMFDGSSYRIEQETTINRYTGR